MEFNKTRNFAILTDFLAILTKSCSAILPFDPHFGNEEVIAKLSGTISLAWHSIKHVGKLLFEVFLPF
jgi:hypothetical protein